MGFKQSSDEKCPICRKAMSLQENTSVRNIMGLPNIDKMKVPFYYCQSCATESPDEFARNLERTFIEGTWYYYKEQKWHALSYNPSRRDCR